MQLTKFFNLSLCAILLFSFEIVAQTEQEEVMAIQELEKMLFGIQFHPESILTENGKQILKNWIIN